MNLICKAFPQIYISQNVFTKVNIPKVSATALPTPTSPSMSRNIDSLMSQGSGKLVYIRNIKVAGLEG